MMEIFLYVGFAVLVVGCLLAVLDDDVERPPDPHWDENYWDRWDVH
jgi:hypothetical protein